MIGWNVTISYDDAPRGPKCPLSCLGSSRQASSGGRSWYDLR